MVGLLVFITVVLALGDVLLWLRFLRPTDVVWERRNRLVAAVLGGVTPVIFLFVTALYAGLIK